MVACCCASWPCQDSSRDCSTDNRAWSLRSCSCSCRTHHATRQAA
jgi:hypothetical protein